MTSNFEAVVCWWLQVAKDAAIAGTVGNKENGSRADATVCQRCYYMYAVVTVGNKKDGGGGACDGCDTVAKSATNTVNVGNKEDGAGKKLN